MEEEEKKSLGTWLEEHPKTVFWSRFALWLTFAGILPFVFIVWRFKLFHAITKMQFGGWGIIAVLIAAIVILVVLKYIRLALKAKYSLIGQCLSGFCKVILPLLLCFAVFKATEDNIHLMLQVLGCITVCEAVAIRKKRLITY